MSTAREPQQHAELPERERRAPAVDEGQAGPGLIAPEAAPGGAPPELPPARPAARPLRQATMQRMQRAYGNAYVQRIVQQGLARPNPMPAQQAARLPIQRR